MGANDLRARREHGWHNLCRGSLNISVADETELCIRSYWYLRSVIADCSVFFQAMLHAG